MAARWSESATELLKQWWNEGHSASLIAKSLGTGFTRNMVIGKAHRLGLPSRPSPIQRANQ